MLQMTNAGLTICWKLKMAIPRYANTHVSAISTKTCRQIRLHVSKELDWLHFKVTLAHTLTKESKSSCMYLMRFDKTGFQLRSFLWQPFITDSGFFLTLQTWDQGCKRDLNLRDRDIRFLVRDETETKTFLQFHETKTRPRHLIFATRRDRDRDLARLRPRRFSRPSTFRIVPKQ